MCSRRCDTVDTEPSVATLVSLRAPSEPRATSPPLGRCPGCNRPDSRLAVSRWAVAAVIEAMPGADGRVMITFRLPRAADAECISVVGDFNGWSTVANPMTRGEDGFVARMSLPVGRAYRFRYLLDGRSWQNDWAADAYVGNEFGGDDSIIDLTVTGSRARMVRAACPGGAAVQAPANGRSAS
jgi:Carbohydrate-binding module 48 (Isoamylase N-terminal domain)